MKAQKSCATHKHIRKTYHASFWQIWLKIQYFFENTSELKNYENSLSYFEQVYEINPEYQNIEQNLKTSKSLIETTGQITVADSPISLPGWIKSNASWWINGQTTDQVIFDALEYLQTKGFIGNYEFSNFSQPHIPNWLVDIVTWWLDEKISDEEFLKTIDYLLKQGIIII